MVSNKKNDTGQKRPQLIISAQDEQIAAMIACGKSQREICEELKISRRYVRTLIDKPWFRAIVSSTVRCHTISAHGYVAEGLKDAIATLILHSTSSERSGDQIRAASLVIDTFIKLREAVDTDDRLSRIEEHIGLNAEEPTPEKDDQNGDHTGPDEQDREVPVGTTEPESQAETDGTTNDQPASPQ